MPEGGRRHGLKTEDLKHLIYGLSIHMIIVWHKLPTGMFFRKYHKKTGLNIPRGSLKQASASAILIYVRLISNFEGKDHAYQQRPYSWCGRASACS